MTRFNYFTAKKNPYFNEACKYLQYYIELMNKLTEYHTSTKLRSKKVPEEFTKVLWEEDKQNKLHMKVEEDVVMSDQPDVDD